MRSLVLFCTLIVLAHLTYGQLGGSATYSFLNFPVSSKLTGIGGSAIALADNDLNLAISNPGLLRKSMSGQLVFNNTFYFHGINQGMLAYGAYLPKFRSTMSTSLQYVQYGKMMETDATGQQIGSFTASDYALGVGLGRNIDKFNYGINGKILYSRYAEFYTAGVAFDLGVAYIDSSHGNSVSLVVKNFGQQTKAIVLHNYEPLPLNIQLGYSKRLAHLPFTFNLVAHDLQKFDIRYNNPADEINSTALISDSSKTNKPKTYLADKIARHLIVGGQIHIKALQIQVGYNHQRRAEMKTTERSGLTGFSFGVGIKIKRFQIGYGQAWYYLPSASNQISLLTTINQPKATAFFQKF